MRPAKRMRLAGMSEEQVRRCRNERRRAAAHDADRADRRRGGELTAREGMTVMAGAPLFRINGLNTVWVNAEVPEDR